MKTFKLTLFLLCAVFFASCTKASNSAKLSGDVMGKFNHSGYPILNEKETFDIYVSQLSPVVAANDKAVVKKAIEETNVVTNFIEVASSSWEEKVNILFSADSLPDGPHTPFHGRHFYVSLHQG